MKTGPFVLYTDSKYKRRKNLIEAMEQLEAKDITCMGCEGTCCTFVANSMQITPLEAYDIYIELIQTGEWTHELKEKLIQTIKSYRLDVEIGDGRGQNIRRTYTCPFFKNKSLGCDISRKIKPYGCLGFNPTTKGKYEAPFCNSRIEELEAREFSLKEEGEYNQNLSKKLGINWVKLPIPLALIRLEQAIAKYF